MAKSKDFAEFVAEYVLRQESEEVDIEDEKELEVLAKLRQRVKPIIERQESHKSSDNETVVRQRSRTRDVSTSDRVNQKETKSSDKTTEEETNKSKGKLINEEKSETGSTKFKVYVKYFQMIGIRSIGIIIISFIVSFMAESMSSLWLSDWSNDSLDTKRITDKGLRIERLGVYAITGCVRAGKVLHNAMVDHIVRAPLVYFDTTPIGRILNRFSRDMDDLDGKIMYSLQTMLLRFMGLVMSLGIISCQMPLTLLAILPIIMVYVWCQRLYIASSRQIKRIDSTSRSPIISHFSESNAGTSTIRAYGATKQFIAKSNRLIDKNNSCHYASICGNSWLTIRLDFLGNCIVLLTAVFAIAFRDTVSPGMAGLTITYALNITLILSGFVRGFSNTETFIVSIERCLELTQTPEEAEWFNDRTKPPPDWPLMGGIMFSNYSTKYRQELDLVLKNITLDVKPRERLAIVGRTGAGKSSLALGLFRLIEATDGTVSIDGIDCSTIGLHDLRSRLTVIPQEPVLFAGSLRHNLDPLDQWSDKEIWSALDADSRDDFPAPT
ncbi:unnamed protein product [Oppiella nova]|uniref:ABC transmembrane type-1 domain-containing protein n=1 Tax=Oppiella nova TaxID=334625 RepID=A0A7R9LP10_9ACAR|nr:unnamed protein product [Oppiella nova]CAG2165517.1 unnamed protein product [Oppiella nova]